MNGVDVSGNQPANILSLIDFEFAIVKASGNPNTNGYKWNFTNKAMRQQVDDALRRTGCAGLYHFAYGIDAKQEADFFIDTVADYVGRAILVLDYEAPLSNKNNREWARTFLMRIKERTGVNAMLYASASVIKDQNLAQLCAEEGCGLWSANYWKGNQTINGYDTSGLKQSVDSVLWQFTDAGKLPGYSGRLDLNVFHGSKDDWMDYAKGNGTATPSKPSGGDDWVRRLQAECNAQGFSRQTVDGIPGKNTLAGCPTCRKGSKGGITKLIQEKLMALGYSLPRYGADGSFGNETVEAVKAFQRAKGLTADGIVGKNTWRALLGL